MATFTFKYAAVRDQVANKVAQGPASTFTDKEIAAKRSQFEADALRYLMHYNGDSIFMRRCKNSAIRLGQSGKPFALLDKLSSEEIRLVMDFITKQLHKERWDGLQRNAAILNEALGGTQKALTSRKWEIRLAEDGNWEALSSDGVTVYQVSLEIGTQGVCTCRGFQHRGACRHLEAVRQTAERLGEH